MEGLFFYEVINFCIFDNLDIYVWLFLLIIDVDWIILLLFLSERIVLRVSGFLFVFVILINVLVFMFVLYIVFIIVFLVGIIWILVCLIFVFIGNVVGFIDMKLFIYGVR